VESERQLAAKEAYLAARAEATADQRNRIVEECRILMKEALSQLKQQNSVSTATIDVASTSAPPSTLTSTSLSPDPSSL